jgi:hypothetical protein
VPTAKRGIPWFEVLRQTRRSQGGDEALPASVREDVPGPAPHLRPAVSGGLGDAVPGAGRRPVAVRPHPRRGDVRSRVVLRGAARPGRRDAPGRARVPGDPRRRRRAAPEDRRGVRPTSPRLRRRLPGGQRRANRRPGDRLDRAIDRAGTVRRDRADVGRPSAVWNPLLGPIWVRCNSCLVRLLGVVSELGWTSVRASALACQPLLAP